MCDSNISFSEPNVTEQTISVESATPITEVTATPDYLNISSATLALPYDETWLELARTAVDHCTDHQLRAIDLRNGSAGAAKKVQIRADNAKEALERNHSTLSYDLAISTTVAKARRTGHINKVLRVRGTSPSYSEPTLLILPRKEDAPRDRLNENAGPFSESLVQTLETSVTIYDIDNDQCIKSEPIRDRDLIESLQEYGHRYATWEYLFFVTTGASGRPSDAGGNTGEFRFFLLHARPMITAIQTVEAQPNEIAEALTLFRTIPDVMAYGMKLLEAALNIVDLDESPILAQVIAFQILAAATEGERAHTFTIGSPGSGKSFVPKAAKLLQPIVTNAMPMKLTEAGLIGVASSRAGHRRSGLLPRAHTGGFSIEDVNQAKGRYNGRIVGALTFVMQDGKVTDASASMTTYETQTSIILDANYTSDVRGLTCRAEGLARVAQDTGIPTNVLSRMTLIAEIPRDVRRRLETSKTKLKTSENTASGRSECAQKELRLLQVYLAKTREIHKDVAILADVAEAMEIAYEQLTAIADTLAEDKPDCAEAFGDFATRLGSQLLMLVQAHARMHNRGTALVDDVNKVFPFLHRKCDWIYTKVLGGQMDARIVNAGEAARRRVIEQALKTWPSATCTADQVRSRIGLDSASPATIQDDLLALLGAPDEQGCFQVITVDRPRD